MVEAVNGRRRIAHVEDEIIVVELCGELQLTKATPGLERRAFGLFGGRTPVSWHARVALAELGHQRAKLAILRGLSAWSRDARTLGSVRSMISCRLHDRSADGVFYASSSRSRLGRTS